MGVVAGEPFGVAGFEVGGHGALGAVGRVAFDVAADVEIGDGDQQVRAGVVVHGNDSAGLEFEFGSADAVFDEENFRGSAGCVRGGVFIPFCGGVAEVGIVEDFDGDVAEGVVGDIADEMGEAGGGEAHIAVGEFGGGGRLAFYVVFDFGGTEVDGDVVVTVPMQQSLSIGVDLDVEDADGFVFQGEVVVRLIRDFDFGSGGLGGQQNREQAEEQVAFHAGDCSTGESASGAEAFS